MRLELTSSIATLLLSYIYNKSSFLSDHLYFQRNRQLLAIALNQNLLSFIALFKDAHFPIEKQIVV